MAVTFLASASAANNGAVANALVVNKPTGTLTGHVMVAFTGSSIGNGFAPPAGWTQIGSTLVASDVDCKAWYKVALAGEAASYSFACTVGQTDNQVAQIATFFGVDQTTPLDANAADTSNTTQNVTGPSVTGVSTRGMVLYHRTVRDVQNSVQTVTSNASKPVASQAEMHIAAPVDVVLGLFYNTQETGVGSQSGTQLNFSHTPTIGQISRTIILKSNQAMTDLSVRASAIHRASRW